MIGGRAGASDSTNVAYGERVDSVIHEAGLSDHVHWTGFVDDPAVTAAFLSSDIIALPYLDGVSLRRGTLMAALAHGRAIVTTSPDSDIPELDGAVATVPSGDSEALALRIKTLWKNDQERGRLEKAAEKVALHFTWGEIAANTISFFEQVLS
jgi:glycosyltransferase involved in cell wall biosynthesis